MAHPYQWTVAELGHEKAIYSQSFFYYVAFTFLNAFLQMLCMCD